MKALATLMLLALSLLSVPVLAAAVNNNDPAAGLNNVDTGTGLTGQYGKAPDCVACQKALAESGGFPQPAPVVSVGVGARPAAAPADDGAAH